MRGITIADAAHLVNAPERTIRRWVADGEVEAALRAGVTYVDATAVEVRAEAWRGQRGRRRARPRNLLT